MQTLKLSSNLSADIRYTITPNGDGVNLTIWEPARENDVRVKPFLFKVNHRLPSSAAAEKVLSDYRATLR